MNSASFDALFQAQRTYRELAKTLQAQNIAPVLAALEHNNRWITEYQSSIARISEFTASSSIQKAIKQMELATSSSALTEMLRSFEQQPIRDFIKEFNASMRTLQPDIAARFAEYARLATARTDFSETLRLFDRSAIIDALDAMVRDAPADAVAELDSAIDSGELASVAESFDAVLDAMAPDDSERGTTKGLTAHQEIWLAMIMLSLIMLLTRESASTTGQDLHGLAVGCLGSILAWGVIRRADKGGE